MVKVRGVAAELLKPEASAEASREISFGEIKSQGAGQPTATARPSRP